MYQKALWYGIASCVFFYMGVNEFFKGTEKTPITYICIAVMFMAIALTRKSDGDHRVK